MKSVGINNRIKHVKIGEIYEIKGKPELCEFGVENLLFSIPAYSLYQSVKNTIYNSHNKIMFSNLFLFIMHTVNITNINTYFKKFNHKDKGILFKISCESISFLFFRLLYHFIIFLSQFVQRIFLIFLPFYSLLIRLCFSH